MKVYVAVLAALLVAKILEYSALSVLEWRTRRKLANAYEAKRSEIEKLAGEAWHRNLERVRPADEAHDAGLD